MEYLRYLGVNMTKEGINKADVSHRVEDGVQVRGVLKRAWKERSVFLRVCLKV